MGKAPGGGKRIAIIQSNYIPWKGYFDMIAACDEFILLDDVQYTRRDWRNRNRIKTPTGVQWLTIPVEVKGKYHQRISDVVVSDAGWARTHWRTLTHCYAKTPHFRDHAPRVEAAYTEVASLLRLTEINERFLRVLCAELGITTPIRRSSEFELPEGASERLLSLCVQSGAACYLSGPAARDYLDTALFTGAGVSVEWMNYDGYPEYSQQHPPFDHAVTVLDLLFNTGRDAPRLMKHLKHTDHGRA